MQDALGSNNRMKTAMIHLILILGAITTVFPFLWMILTSLKTLGETTHIPPIFFPHKFLWSNYANVLTTLPFGQLYWNTFLSTVVTTIVNLLFASMAAYAFAILRFRGSNQLFLLFLSILMVPGAVFLIPQFLIMKDMGWLNSLTALIVPGVFSAFGTFLLRQFFKTIPREIMESAKIDGCYPFGIYWRIILPLGKTGILALGIMTSLGSWNSLMWPLIVNTSIDKMTLAAGLAQMNGLHSTEFPLLMAGSTMACLPMLLLFILFQRQFIEGISLTGSK